MLQVERAVIDCRAARTPDEVAAHHAVRRRVFVDEQHVFAGSDRDVHDDDPLTVHAIGLIGAAVAGTVRLFPLDGDGIRWQGDRLAVLSEYRTHGLGAPLVRYAMRTAGDRGGQLMVAHVQLANVTFFRRLGWRRDGDVETYVGLPHQPMSVDLTGK